MLRFRSSLPLALPLLLTLATLPACDGLFGDDGDCTGIAECYPVPTELPAATCTGANTLGARVDSILFVANYAPNTTSWGHEPAPGGVTAYYDVERDVIRIQGEHPIRPHEVDKRNMGMTIDLRGDSVVFVYFDYRNWGNRPFNLMVARTLNPADVHHTLAYDAVARRVCGTFDAGNPAVGDTIRLLDGRLDVPVNGVP